MENETSRYGHEAAYSTIDSSNDIGETSLLHRTELCIGTALGNMQEVDTTGRN